jgi:hypothetical protein
MQTTMEVLAGALLAKLHRDPSTLAEVLDDHPQRIQRPALTAAGEQNPLLLGLIAEPIFGSYGAPVRRLSATGRCNRLQRREHYSDGTTDGV